MDIGFIVLELIFIAVFLAFEVRNFVTDRFAYFTNFWNLIDFCSIILNVVYITCDLSNVDRMKMRTIGASCVLLMWVKFFYYLRIFEPTAQFIKLMTVIIRNLSTFGFTFLLAVIAFTNSFYIMGLNDYDTQYLALG